MAQVRGTEINGGYTRPKAPTYEELQKEVRDIRSGTVPTTPKITAPAPTSPIRTATTTTVPTPTNTPTVAADPNAATNKESEIVPIEEVLPEGPSTQDLIQQMIDAQRQSRYAALDKPEITLFQTLTTKKPE
jgi:hypothetical protein